MKHPMTGRQPFGWLQMTRWTTHALAHKLAHDVRDAERGTSALELALVIPVFLLLLFGALDFGLSIVLYNVTSEAARDGARAGQVMIMQGHTSLSATDISNIQTAATAVAGPLAGLGTGLTVTPTTEQDATGNYYVKTTATASYTPVLRAFLGGVGTINVGATSKLAVPCGMC